MSAVDTLEQSQRNGSESDSPPLTLSTHKVILQVLRSKTLDYGYPVRDKRLLVDSKFVSRRRIE